MIIDARGMGYLIFETVTYISGIPDAKYYFSAVSGQWLIVIRGTWQELTQIIPSSSAGVTRQMCSMSFSFYEIVKQETYHGVPVNTTTLNVVTHLGFVMSLIRP